MLDFEVSNEAIFAKFFPKINHFENLSGLIRLKCVSSISFISHPVTMEEL